MQFLNSANICEKLTKTDDGRLLMSYVHFTFGRVAFFCFQLDSIKMILIFFLILMHTFQLMNFRYTEQELPTLPEYLGSPRLLGSCCSTFDFISNVL